MAQNSEHKSTSINKKLLIISADCDPKAELPLPGDSPVVTWNAVVDALTTAKYCFAMLRLPTRITENPNHIENSRSSSVAFLSLKASKKVAFFSGDDFADASFEITYDDPNLMNGLPSFCTLKGLPRFHLFQSLPEDLQLGIVDRLDGVEFSRMRCVSRWFNRLSRPEVPPPPSPKELTNNGKSGGGRGFFWRKDAVRGFVITTVCFVVVMYDIVREEQFRRPVYGDEDDDDEYMDILS